MRTKLLLPPLLWILIFSGCITEIPLPNENITPKGSVIHLYMQPDSILILKTAQVVGILDNTFRPSNATIDISKNHEASTRFLWYAEGVFTNPYTILKARDSFSIKYVSDIDSFSITGQLPSEIHIIKVDTSTDIISGIGSTQSFVIKFKDSALDRNYYRIWAKRKVIIYLRNASHQIIDSTISWKTMKIDGTDLNFIRNNYNNYTDEEILFSDDNFNGVTNSFKVYNLLPFANSKTEKTMAVIITVENINASLYQYFNSRAAHIWQQKSITQLPGQLQGNIPNGYGVIGGLTKDEWLIQYQ